MSNFSNSIPCEIINQNICSQTKREKKLKKKKDLIKILLFNPRPKPSLIINATKHASECLFLDWWWLWVMEEYLGHGGSIGPHGRRWEEGSSSDGGGGGSGGGGWMSWKFKCAFNCCCGSSWDIQLYFRAILTSIAAWSFSVLVQVYRLCWFSIF